MVPGTIHEGGELGYALATAFGAVLDNPDLIAACIVGDGEAETGPTAGAWHSNKFLDPATCGAVLPILHVNGYKIANPTIYKTMSNEELTKLFEGFGWHPLIVEGEDLDAGFPTRSATAYAEIRELQSRRARRHARERPALADDRPALAEGLDRAQGGRRDPDRGHLEGPPGAGDAGAHEPRAPGGRSRTGCAPTGPGSCSTKRRPDPGVARRVPDGRPAHGREPARQRRAAAQAAEPPRRSTSTRSTCARRARERAAR